MSKPPLLPDWNAAQRVRSVFSAIILLENPVYSCSELRKERVIPWGLKEYLLAARKLKAISAKGSGSNESLGNHVVAKTSFPDKNTPPNQWTDAVGYKEQSKSGTSTKPITPI